MRVMRRLWRIWIKSVLVVGSVRLYCRGRRDVFWFIVWVVKRNVVQDVAGRDMGMSVEGWVDHKVKKRKLLHVSLLEMCFVRWGINLKGKVYIPSWFGVTRIIIYFHYLLSMSGCNMKLLYDTPRNSRLSSGIFCGPTRLTRNRREHAQQDVK